MPPSKGCFPYFFVPVVEMSVTLSKHWVKPLGQPAPQSGLQLLCPHAFSSQLWSWPPLPTNQSVSPLCLCLCLCPGQLSNHSAPLLPVCTPSTQTSFPAPGCDVVTFPRRRTEIVLVLNVFVHWRGNREKVLARGRQLLFPTARGSSGGNTAGCRGGEAARRRRRRCCCCRAEPSGAPRPGRIRPLLLIWTQEHEAHVWITLKLLD